MKIARLGPIFMLIQRLFILSWQDAASQLIVRHFKAKSNFS